MPETVTEVMERYKDVKDTLNRLAEDVNKIAIDNATQSTKMTDIDRRIGAIEKHLGEINGSIKKIPVHGVRLDKLEEDGKRNDDRFWKVTAIVIPLIMGLIAIFK